MTIIFVVIYFLAATACYSFFEYDFDPPPWPIRWLIALLWPCWLALIGMLQIHNLVSDKWNERRRKRKHKQGAAP